jgi:hypothetical protein
VYLFLLTSFFIPKIKSTSFQLIFSITQAVVEPERWPKRINIQMYCELLRWIPYSIYKYSILMLLVARGRIRLCYVQYWMHPHLPLWSCQRELLHFCLCISLRISVDLLKIQGVLKGILFVHLASEIRVIPDSFSPYYVFPANPHERDSTVKLA